MDRPRMKGRLLVHQVNDDWTILEGECVFVWGTVSASSMAFGGCYWLAAFVQPSV